MVAVVYVANILTNFVYVKKIIALRQKNAVFTKLLYSLDNYSMEAFLSVVSALEAQKCRGVTVSIDSGGGAAERLRPAPRRIGEAP